MKKFTTYKIEKEQDGFVLETYLKQTLQYSGRKIQKLTRKKGILLNGKAVFLQKKVKFGDMLRILNFEDAAYGVEPEDGNITILYEDEYMLVLNKPARQLVHPTGQTTSGTLANYLAYELQKRNIVTTIRPVHRLDRETSGCIIFAKDSRSQFILEQQLKEKTLKRTYWALVSGIVGPSSGRIDAPIGVHPSKPNRRAINQLGEPAITHYRTVAHYTDTSLVELNLDTGRTHQIRLHLAHLGYPILGDGMYGVRFSGLLRQALHATCITFRRLQDHNEITVQAPLPQDFIKAMEVCKKKEKAILPNR